MARIRRHVEDCANLPVGIQEWSFNRNHAPENLGRRLSVVLPTITLCPCCYSLTCLQHSIHWTKRLLRRLDHTCGVPGRPTSHKWVDSYLSGRCQYVKVCDRVSSSVRCDYGVPQGSVLGSLLFSIYTSPIVDVITPFTVDHHAQYAAETFSEPIYFIASSLHYGRPA